MKTGIIVVLMVVLLAVVGYGAYTAGQSNGLTEAQNIRTQFFQTRSGTAGSASSAGSAGTNVRSQATRPVASGTIKSIQGDVVEVTQQDGTSVLVALSGQTVIEKTVTGATSDLQVGQRISVEGVQSTGQVNAQVIQISQSGQ